jgi:hypothetical protein
MHSSSDIFVVVMVVGIGVVCDLDFVAVDGLVAYTYTCTAMYAAPITKPIVSRQGGEAKQPRTSS